ncbi:MAG TPA: hypothetical protein VFW40_11405 [Capsulimonadaceae bacterium]|nr:hypothetical protein [Capsulimonadaceae bacterium]
MIEQQKSESYESDRTFRLYGFHVSHSRLLFRAPRSESDPVSENIDIKFYDVDYLETTWLYHGISIRETQGDELLKLKERCGALSGQGDKFFSLNTDTGTFYIGAAAYSVSANRLPPLDFGFDNLE